MKSRWIIISALIALVLAFPNIKAVFAQDPVGNLVHAELSQGNWYSTDKDSVENIPLVWSHMWHFPMINTPDGGPPVLNPKVELQTNLNLVRFLPDDPSVFTANPPFYTWNFAGLQLKEPEHLPLGAIGIDDTIIAKPRVSTFRSVQPEILTEPVTFQTVRVVFRLEEPLPLGVNTLSIGIGTPLIAYDRYRLVEGYFVSQIPVEGWNSGTDGVSASWDIDPSKIEVGRTYEFQATLKSIKSIDLLGSPIFKPEVQVMYLRWRHDPMVTGNSVTITDPDNIISATFSADNIVDWAPGFNDSRFGFALTRVVSQTTTSPPFHVLIPATVRIEPETLNLKSKGVITAFVQLPEQYSVKNIDISTVKCQGAPAVRGVIAGSTLILKFNRQELQNVVPGEEAKFLVTGQLTDGSIFEAMDVVRVIN